MTSYNDIFERYPLLITMSKLRSARFNAAERLANRYRWHSTSLVVFSIYTIALTIFDKFVPTSNQQLSYYLSFISVVSSVFVVALSMYLAFSEDIVRGKYLHDNAKLVKNLYQELKTKAVLELNSNNEQELNIIEYQQRYQTIMDSCPYNHNTIDHKLSLISEESEKTGVSKKIHETKIRFEYLSNQYFWAFAAITGPALLILICVFIFGGPNSPKQNFISINEQIQSDSRVTDHPK